MLKRQPMVLAGLLLIFLLVACIPETTRDESDLPNDYSVIAGYSSTDSQGNKSTEPPPAMLTIDGHEQTAGITSYCWQQDDGTGICADAIGVTTDPESIPAGSTFLAEFALPQEAPPGRVQLSIFPAAELASTAPVRGGWPYLDGYEWADFVGVRPINHTLDELQADQAIASRAANSVNVLVVTTVDIINNRVELIVGNPNLFLGELAQAGIELPESVVVLANDTGGELPGTNRGVLLEAIANDDRTIYLPVQPTSGSSMAALNEGALVEVDGCLRINDGHYAGGWLVLWPFGSDIRVTDNGVEVINEDGKPVARVGEWMRAGGGAVENTHGMADLDEMISDMPIDSCPGPYRVAVPLETMQDQSVPDVYFQPFSSGDQILAWFANQSRPSSETEVLSGELKLDETGCLRLEEYLLILPPETYLREDPLRIVDRGLDEIAQIGGSIQATGAEKEADDYLYFDSKVRCSGPYWGVNQISTAE